MDNLVKILYVKHNNLTFQNVKEMRTAATKELLMKALGVGETEIGYNKYGKPFLKEGQGPFFSISHGRDYSIIAVCDKDLGADIEEIQDSERKQRFHDSIAKKVFSETDRDYYFSVSPEEKPFTFTKLWTKLEAILKANGTGFYLDPRKSPEIFDGWQVKSMELNDHIISVAMREDFSITLREV